jgi:hypothetical protein
MISVRCDGCNRRRCELTSGLTNEIGFSLQLRSRAPADSPDDGVRTEGFLRHAEKACGLPGAHSDLH